MLDVSEASATLRVRALAPLPEGGAVAVSYHTNQQQWLEQPTEVRKAMVLAKLGFVCVCTACVQPGETGGEAAEAVPIS
eukprot:306191-Prymnesium_polylepis.1